MELLAATLMGLSIESVGWAQEAGKESKAQPSASAGVPDLYDDFSDGRYEKRTGKDPGGRPLPEWKVVDGSFEVKDGCLQGVRNPCSRIRMRSAVAYGTWEWKYRYPAGTIHLHGVPMHSTGCMFIQVDDAKPDAAKGYWWGGKNDTHLWFQRRDGGGGHAKQLLHDHPNNWGVSNPTDDRWHTVTITRDAKGAFTLYQDGELVTDGAGGFFKDVVDDTFKTSQYLWVQSVGSGPGGDANLPQVDDFKVWEGKVLPPTAFAERMKRTAGKINVLIDQKHTCGYWTLLHYYKSLLEMIEQRGAVLKVVNQAKLSPELLENFDVYVVFPLAGGYSPEEAAALVQFVQRGGRALVFGGTGEVAKDNAVNSWLKEFGLSFRPVGGSDLWTEIVAHPLTEGVKSVHGLGCTYLDVKDPAKALISSKNGAAVAVFEGKGRIVCIADEWPLMLARQGGRNKPATDMPEEGIASTKYDHKKLAENIAAWLAAPVNK